VLERPEPLGRLPLHLRSRTTMIAADSTTGHRRILTPPPRLPRVSGAPSWVSRVLATLERGHRRYFSLEFHGCPSSMGSASRRTCSSTVRRIQECCDRSRGDHDAFPRTWRGTHDKHDATREYGVGRSAKADSEPAAERNPACTDYWVRSVIAQDPSRHGDELSQADGNDVPSFATPQ
jgi:hypothetical protein